MDADDKLDAQAKVNADAIAQEVTDRGTAVTGEATARAAQDDAIEAGAGLDADGGYDCRCYDQLPDGCF